MAWKLVRVQWLYDPEPYKITHWETQPSPNGFDGFWFERDSYLEMRSSAIVAVTITVDGVAQAALPIASTADERLKVYIPFPAIKGKLYRYQFDSASPFYIYAWSCRAHTWRGESPYRHINPLTGTESPWNVDAVRGDNPRII